jgi:hypothetical protein
LFKRLNAGYSLLALLSQSRAAYRNSKRGDDYCNGRNPHGECLLLFFGPQFVHDVTISIMPVPGLQQSMANLRQETGITEFARS